jgi:hypothetical protein
MDAEKVLDLWRRVLRSDSLQRELFAEGDRLASHSALPAADRAFASALAEHRTAVRWPIEGFRYRLIDQWVTDLETTTPVTTAVLGARGLDLRSLATRYLQATGWPDPGALSMGACRDLLGFLAGEIPPADADLHDLISLESLVVRQLITLAASPPITWTKLATSRHDPALAYHQSPAAAAITLGHDLRPWLGDADRTSAIRMKAAVSHYAVLIESPDHAPEILALDHTEKALFDAFGDPAPFAEALNTARLAPGDGAKAMDSLLELGLVRPASTGEKR